MFSHSLGQGLGNAMLYMVYVRRLVKCTVIFSYGLGQEACEMQGFHIVYIRRLVNFTTLICFKYACL